jgi:hypothetical protein
LQPVNGIVTGEQAKGFLLQSRLTPQILGQIWYDTYDEYMYILSAVKKLKWSTGVSRGNRHVMEDSAYVVYTSVLYII